MEKNKINLKYSIIFLIGTLLTIASSFHTALWYDEAYTVGLMGQNFTDMIKLATKDVHPYLYYIGLKIFTYIFGSSIIGMRIFSVIGAALCASLGYTHIRKDFGDKVGTYYTILAFLLPTTFKYAGQIRMYTWASYFVGLCAIYAYRYVKNPKNKNAILLVVSCTLASYTHYFALFTCGMINIYMFIYYLKAKKIKSDFLKVAIPQVALCIPGAVLMIYQALLGGAGWLGRPDIETIGHIFTFQFVGDVLYHAEGLPVWIGILLGILEFACVVYSLRVLIKGYKSGEKDVYPALMAYAVYISVILVTVIVSFVRPIFYIRYVRAMFALSSFVYAYVISKINIKKVEMGTLAVLLAIFFVRATPVFVYSVVEKGDVVSDYMKENVSEEDMIVFGEENAYSAYILSSYVPKSATCMYRYGGEDWGEETFEAFSQKSIFAHNDEELKEIISLKKNKIFLVDSSKEGNGESFEKMQNLIVQSGLYKEVCYDRLEQKYYSYVFKITVYELVQENS